MITRTVFSGSRRGLDTLTHVMGPDPFRTVAKQLLRIPGPILIVTGFYIPQADAAETDGPPGAAALGAALTRLGKSVHHVTCPFGENLVKEMIHHTGIPQPVTLFKGEGSITQMIQDLFPDAPPHAVIAIERPGPNANGRYLTARNIDITHVAAGFEPLFQIPEIYRIAIGDGGNELGMGALATCFPENPAMCTLSADATLIGSVSNWVAYGLIAALEISTGITGLLPLPQWDADALKILSKSGAVDGMTAAKTATVDGFTWEESGSVLEKLHIISRLATPINNLTRAFFQPHEPKHPIKPGTLTITADPDNFKINMTGNLLLQTHLDTLTEIVTSEIAQIRRESPDAHVNFQVKILSDPATPSIQSFALSSPLNIYSRPEGPLATQLLPDECVRILWEHQNWRLVQTPDLALGWCLHSHLISLSNPESDPPVSWKCLNRAIPGKITAINATLQKITCVAHEFLGIPYLLGGRSPAGIDCSALMQLIFKPFNLYLPRNSRDQRKCGIRIPFSQTQSGDFLFAVNTAHAVHHVALLLPEGIFHASLNSGKVVTQSLDLFKKHYRIVAVRRIASYKEIV